MAEKVEVIDYKFVRKSNEKLCKTVWLKAKRENEVFIYEYHVDTVERETLSRLIKKTCESELDSIRTWKDALEHMKGKKIYKPRKMYLICVNGEMVV